ncbi:MAG: response regulator [Curvibacter sp.]|nr:response regulator [Curvibacter sp.]
MQSQPSALIIDDEKIIRRFIANSLRDNGWKIFEAATARQAMTSIAADCPDLVVLDLGLPDQDGQSILKDLRSWSMIPIIVVSGRTNEYEKISALEAGADDYVIKPFSIGELIARINAAHKRKLRYTQKSVAQISRVRFGDVEVDLIARRIKRAGQSVHLTSTEYKLLSYMIANAGKVLTHRQILNAVWSGKNQDDIQYLRVYMRSLRQKLERDPAAPEFILTESAVGYILILDNNE